MKAVYRITLEELAKMVGVSSYTIRTWVSSYKFAKYMRYDNFFGERNKLSIMVSKEFCKDFIFYLSRKGSKGEKYIKNFSNYFDKLNL